MIAHCVSKHGDKTWHGALVTLEAHVHGGMHGGPTNVAHGAALSTGERVGARVGDSVGEEVGDAVGACVGSCAATNTSDSKFKKKKAQQTCFANFITVLY